MTGREEDVAAVYQSGDPQLVQDILERYGVRYVYAGNRERDKYGRDNLATLDSLLEIAWEGYDVIIYEFKPSSPERAPGSDDSTSR